MTHKVKGIVLRTVKYGETSVIATLYTDLFGLQSYLVKGVRKSSKSGASKINYFQPGAILELQAYHNPFKSLQFIKEYQWSYLYTELFFHVTRSAIAMYMLELILHCIKQEETNNELFDFFEHFFISLDKQNLEEIADYPLTFTLHLAKFLGFQIHGNYSSKTPILDLQEGMFVAEKPYHNYVVEDNYAAITSELNNLETHSAPKSLQLNHLIRRELLKYYQQFFSLHLQNTSEMKSFRVLQAVLQ
ncbi:DNA repair protein RecO [Arachidicoccus ginsenosidimutans]|uniref:DNA repair protein RecO n=1 Tax=Arachidicoccus sp. BS20 TaxID=1850526 RepID=UPI0007F10FD6|nr:DNA repair protein RecO [Arachidicoccus sp. BS20]ANI88684.1 DNA repair protein RecO [Arachidicoccus sp. BS20]